MTGIDLALWGAVVALGSAAAWWTLPRPLALDWELHFKVALSTLVRGEVEAAGGGMADWLARARTVVWYHAGGRDLEAKIADPAGYEVPIPARPGERALLEQLGRAAAEQRLAVAWDAGDPCLFDDPEALGPEFAPACSLGPQVTWEDVAAWNEAVVSALRRRHEHTRFAVLGRPGLVAPLGEALGEERALVATADELEALVPELSDRLVVVVAGAEVAALLETAKASPALRDRMRAVVGLGVQLEDLEAWLAEHFTHERMDTEVSRATPWFHLAWVDQGVDPLGVVGTPLATTRFPTPPVPPTGRVALEPIDLGVLPGPSSGLDDTLLARALLLTLTARLEG